MLHLASITHKRWGWGSSLQRPHAWGMSFNSDKSDALRETDMPQVQTRKRPMPLAVEIWVLVNSVSSQRQIRGKRPLTLQGWPHLVEFFVDTTVERCACLPNYAWAELSKQVGNNKAHYLINWWEKVGIRGAGPTCTFLQLRA